MLDEILEEILKLRKANEIVKTISSFRNSVCLDPNSIEYKCRKDEWEKLWRGIDEYTGFDDSE